MGTGMTLLVSAYTFKFESRFFNIPLAVGMLRTYTATGRTGAAPQIKRSLDEEERTT